MGIRFQCPACGAKLNVKAELAGKRGACPKCQAKLQIPQADEETAPAQASPIVSLANAPSAAEPTLSAPVTPQQAFVSPAPVEAKWFVRPPSGGQYGPALESVLRQWVGEGRITPDTLVRRTTENESQWQSAASVFPELGAGPVIGAPTASPASPVLSPAVQIAPVETATPAAPADPASAAAAMLLARRKRARKTGLMVMAILIVAVLILLPVLIYVLTNQGAPTTEEPKSALYAPRLSHRVHLV